MHAVCRPGAAFLLSTAADPARSQADRDRHAGGTTILSAYPFKKPK